MFDAIRPVLTIVVANNRWDAYGADTLAHQALFQALRDLGGISSSVPDGTYDFEIRQHGIAPPEYFLSPAN